MGSDMRMFAAPIVAVFVVAIIYSIAATADPKLVPFSSHPHEVSAVVSAPTAQPTSAATAATSPTPGGGAPTLTLVGQNLQFDKSTLTAKAGTVTIQFDNKDQGIPHNLHVYKGKDATGDSAGATDISTGPTTSTLTLNLAAGSYYYQCDVHPTTMNGTLTVN